MKLGRIGADIYYIVDLDDPKMVKQAEKAIYKDLMEAVKNNDLSSCIGILDENVELRSEFISEFLKEQV